MQNIGNKLAQVDIGAKFGSTLTTPDTIGTKFVSNFIAGAISIAGVVLLYFLVMGGIGIISGAGQNDPQKLAQGKKAATTALIGFIIVMASYWIVQLIGQITGLQTLLLGGQ